MATTDTAIPPRLSELQQFILAFAASAGRTATVGVRRDAVQNAVIEEFAEYRRETRLGDGWNKKPITPAGSSALSRSFARLEDRGLIERERASIIGVEPNTVWVRPTADGTRVGAELLHRHADGRYSLCFETLCNTGLSQ